MTARPGIGTTRIGSCSCTRQCAHSRYSPKNSTAPLRVSGAARVYRSDKVVARAGRSEAVDLDVISTDLNARTRVDLTQVYLVLAAAAHDLRAFVAGHDDIVILLHDSDDW